MEHLFNQVFLCLLHMYSCQPLTCHPENLQVQYKINVCVKYQLLCLTGLITATVVETRQLQLAIPAVGVVLLVELSVWCCYSSCRCGAASRAVGVVLLVELSVWCC